jgi:hypothetical protein
LEHDEITNCGIATLTIDVDSKELLFASILYNLKKINTYDLNVYEKA